MRFVPCRCYSQPFFCFYNCNHVSDLQAILKTARLKCCLLLKLVQVLNLNQSRPLCVDSAEYSDLNSLEILELNFCCLLALTHTDVTLQSR